MNPWDSLAAELDRWAAMKSTASFWWRDDDAIEPTVALERLLSLRSARDIPLALAVVPARATYELADAVPAVGVAVLQHGYAHVDHERGSAKKSEFGPSRPARRASRDLTAGWSRLRDLFDDRALPILVPPWNRMARGLLHGLPTLGYHGVSMFAPRLAPLAAPGLVRVNTHVDIVEWDGSRGFVGERAALESIVGHLSRRRVGAVASDEPTGILTHHLVHDDGCHAFLQRLLPVIENHPAARWVAADRLFLPDR